MIKRTCTQCGEAKPLDCFHNAKRGKYGKQPKCKECKSSYCKESFSLKMHEKRKQREHDKQEALSLAERGLKECGSCKTVKLLDDFYNNSSKHLGKTSRCKSCDLEGKKADYLKHREKRLAAAKARQDSNPESRKRYLKNWYIKNRKRQIAKNAIWQRDNRDRISENTKRRRRSDPDFVVAVAARGMLRRHIKNIGGEKANRTHEILGYTPDQLREHIERQFAKGMNWGNYGTDWHIDHIVSMSEHIQNGETDPSIVNCLTNLMPLWAEDNLRKGSLRTRLI